MVKLRGGIVIVAIAMLCVAVLAVGSASALAVQDNGSDIEDNASGIEDNASDIGDLGDDIDGVGIETDAKCLTGDGSSFVVGSEEDTHIWVRLHISKLTDSGGSFGAELAGSTEDERVIEIAVGLEHVGGGFTDTLTNPTSSFEIVGAFDFQLSIFDEATPDVDAPGLEDEEGAPEEDDSGDADEAGTDDSPFELIDC